MEKTLTIIKNESIKRGLVGKIIATIEATGLKIVKMRMAKPSLRLAKRHYLKDPEWISGLGNKAINLFKNKEQLNIFGTNNTGQIGEIIYKWSVEQLVGKDVIVVVWEGNNAIAKVKEIVGSYEPAFADLSTIRGMFSNDSYRVSAMEKRAVHNVVHRSSSVEEATREIGVWFE